MSVSRYESSSLTVVTAVVDVPEVEAARRVVRGPRRGLQQRHLLGGVGQVLPVTVYVQEVT